MSSVRVISPDWAAIRAGLRSWAEDLVTSDANVLGVLLFGSLARDDHAPGSDGDIILVVRQPHENPRERPARPSTPDVDLPVDLTVYTEAELSRLIGEGLPFLVRALAEGRWLAAASDWTSP